jgi:ABC-2 type transport system permease protein
MVTPLLSTLIAGPRETLFGANLAYFETEQVINWLSPNNLYSDITQALLQPKTRALGIGSVIQLIQQRGAIPAPLPASQSFILIWPQLTGLVAATIVIFAIAYIAFQRQEIRA